MAGLSTHVLDTSIGKPAANILIELFAKDQSEAIKSCTTNADGRTDAPLIAAGELAEGTYELHFHAGDYFRAKQTTAQNATVLFLDVVVIRFGIGHTDQHYHVPLLLSTYGYSTYRGS